MSARLANVLRKAGYRSLRDLHGISRANLLEVSKCGIRSVGELERLIECIVTGGFDRMRSPVAGEGCAALIGVIDDLIARLDARKRNILLLRLGAKGKKPLTLEEIGARYDFARQHVQQVFNGLLDEMRRLGGPPLHTMLQRIAETRLKKFCPLTPELVQRWAGVRSLRFGAQFYVRLLGEMEPCIPAWPEGQPAAGAVGRHRPIGVGARGRVLGIEIRRLLSRRSSAMPLREAFETLSASPDLEGLTAREFLDGLKRLYRSQSVHVEMDPTDYALVSYRNVRTRHWVHEVLTLSDQPLTPGELLDRARNLYGKDFRPPTLLRFHRFADPPPGGPKPQFFLLGPWRLGLVKHITLAQGLWPQVMSDCYELLALEKRPLSTVDIIEASHSTWSVLTNPYELAAILRTDDRFVHLRRMAVGLKEWGIRRRVPMSSVVEEVLADAGRPLPAYKIRDEARRHRSLRYRSLSPILRAHPNLSNFGHGYYGLKSLGNRAKQMLAAEKMYVNRVIASSTEPLTFEQLCRAVGVSSKGRLAAVLWKTVQSLPKVNIKECGRRTDAVISHRYWGERESDRERRRRIREVRELQRENAD